MLNHPLARAAVAALALLAGLASAGTATAAETGAASNPAAKTIPQATCFWTDQVASKFSDDPALNYAFPDTGAIYWSSKLSIPVGARVILKGKYAHARYTSINSYKSSDNTPTDALNDVSTKPDKGSKNPFLAGAKRDTGGGKRHYTVKILNEEVPATKAANTLYAGVPGQAEQQLLYRVYLPDSFKQKELTGGVGLPKAQLKLADGTVLKGNAACEALQIEAGPLAITTLPESVYDTLRGDDPTFPASDPTEWLAYYNTGFLLGCGYNGKCDGDPERIGGQYSNIDNSYVSAWGSRAFSDGPVWVLKGKLPQTQTTGKNVERMPAGDMRYWSLCQNESFVTTIGAGCLYDSQVPTDKKGNYTIVSSLGADRPANATAKCGVGFIPWPVNGDGAGHPDDGFMVLRNMLPADGFGHAVQDTATPGDESAVMGSYLPKGSYTTKAAFEQKGC
jgi:hypothetical protein